ncbi:glycosyltransferase [Vibrio breoganii]|uniref:glycosyltransferase n=1 Tax=Vibrio breoganii TaxID=553239 RepID=UPI000317881F|nr:glycosyltransferase [Vibrio breoganii]OED98873.1 hypothetical protein A1QE_00595 [Vibrio breoganii ZF-55]
MIKDVVFILPEIKGGGAEKSVINLCKSLEEYAGYKTHLLILNNKIEYDVTGLRVHDLNLTNKVSKKGWKRLTYRKEMARLVDNYILDNFSSNTPIFSNMVFSDKIMSQSKLNVFHIIRNSYSKPMLSGKNLYRKYVVKKNISKVYSNHPIVFVSHGARNDFNNNFIAKTPQAVVHNAIDAEEIRRNAKAYDFSPKNDYILHIGRFNRQKRHDRLLDIYNNTQKKVNLRLMGKGELEKDIRNKIEELGINHNIDFEPFNENPYPIIKQAKLVVLTSDFEGLPRVLMEAVVLNKPVISFDCPGGIREILSNDESIVKLGDIKSFSSRIDDALDCPDKYINEVPGDFSFESVANNFKALIEGGIGNGMD